MYCSLTNGFKSVFDECRRQRHLVYTYSIYVNSTSASLKAITHVLFIRKKQHKRYEEQSFPLHKIRIVHKILCFIATKRQDTVRVAQLLSSVHKLFRRLLSPCPTAGRVLTVKWSWSSEQEPPEERPQWTEGTSRRRVRTAEEQRA